MKTTLLAISFAILANPFTALSQSPGLVAKFGVDGELANDTLRLGAGSPVGSHDWLKQKAGTGIGLVDTTGTSFYKPIIASGGNVIFTRGQSISRFAIVDNMYMLDTRYGRDGYGLSTQSGEKDSTVFLSGNQGGGIFYSNKNGENPYNWRHAVGGTTVQNKNDIIDIYAHMRRNGTDINATNPSPLYLHAGASTLGVEGERNIDFELFKSRISFNPATGFSNSGPNETGGHSVWTFNADGTVKSTGDMLVSFNYNTTSVSDVSVFIWVSATTKSSLNPLYFDFIPSEFFGEGPNPAYGYCKITQNGGLPNFEFFATTNTFTSTGPFWGTSSKDLGTSPNNYAANDYAAGQFSEIAVNLTSLGIDPALGNAGTTTDPCAPPFTRIIVKTRASNTYTAELKDFTGPYPFLDAPQVPQQIAPANLTCTNNTTTLAPLNPQAGAFYVWSTIGGNILSNPIAQSIAVSGEGKYFLTASIVSGCMGLTDSIILTKDTYQPVATASTVGNVNLFLPSMMATLIGGDSAASNFMTHYGNSSGLTWEWTGPGGYTANTRNALTNNEGTYRLILTETRNGCKDTAETNVFSVQTLPVKLNNFQGSKNKNNVQLQWNVGLNEIANTFEVERSKNGKDFATAALLFGTEKSGNETYSYNEVNEDAKVYYRLKMVDKSDVLSYSKILVFNTTSKNANKLDIIGNSVSDKLTVSFQSDINNAVELRVLDMNGRLIVKQSVNANKGNNLVSISLPAAMNTGMYIASLSSENVNSTAKFIKQ